jgi:hypothetical protein
MRSWTKERLRRLRVAKAVSTSGEYPKSLPNPDFAGQYQNSEKLANGLATVGVFLGPYRNLTTLTASFLFLHPECQVLNHAGSRILEDESTNFFVGYSDRKFQEFCRQAILISQGGTRGTYGGSVVLSHAFAEHESMRNSFAKRYGTNLLKKKMRSLVWKESYRVTRLLREQKTDFGDLFANNAHLRFVMPIRNPIDCAQSIIKKGMQKKYGDSSTDDYLKLLDINLDAMKWFLELQDRHPDRFFHFYQDQLDANVLEELATFLGLSKDERWIRDTLGIYKLRRRDDYGPNVVSQYERRIASVFAGKAEVIARFNELVSPLAVNRRAQNES